MSEQGSTDTGGGWPVDKLNALRLGRRLVAEVAASGPGRRAFVSINPIATPEDVQAGREGWVRADRDRSFRMEHWGYDADGIDGYDYDIGAVLIREARAEGEAALVRTLEEWGLRTAQFRYPWETDDPV